MIDSAIPREIGEWMGKQLFEHVPSNIAVINRDYEIVVANDSFSEVFGDTAGKHCYEAFKKKDSVCKNCLAAQTFEDGKVRVGNEYGLDRNGRPAYHVVHNAPIYNEAGEIVYVIEMSYDVTDTKSLQRQYNILFERVPCYVAVLDEDLKIVRANEMLRNTFGESRGQHCYRVYKHRHDQCSDCPAMKTFSDGESRTREQVGIDKNGKLTQYLVSTAPLSKSGDKVNHVIEMSIDVTEAHKLSRDLLKESYFRHQLTENTMDALVGADTDGVVNIFNPAAERLFNTDAVEVIGKPRAWEFMPPDFRSTFDQGRHSLFLPETTVHDSDGAAIPVRFSGTVLRDGASVIGVAAFFQDLRELKKMEREKLTNERLAVVGQTVAQLAHGMKNILTGIQGGLYGIRVGIKKNDTGRLTVGRERLERNVSRINDLVRGFLNYTREHTPQITNVDLNSIAEEVWMLFLESAGTLGIRLDLERSAGEALADVDSEDIHTCLANLVANAIDACRDRDEGDVELVVTIRILDLPGKYVIEVSDNGCGMDEKTRKKVFNTFFTTKGLEGNGLGLLITSKLVRSHRGELHVNSIPGEGSEFRIELPKNGKKET